MKKMGNQFLWLQRLFECLTLYYQLEGILLWNKENYLQE